jgi:putative SbcD/Mre11-related phosphoesterase
MDRTRLELEPGLWLDAGRAVWLEQWRTLAVADLHLGYAWAHRAQGQLMPVEAGEDSVERLQKLLERYPAEEVLLLGDVIHRAVEAPAVLADLRALASAVEGRARLRLIAGNHDRDLKAMLAKAKVDLEITKSAAVGPHLLLHGDEPSVSRAKSNLEALPGRVILGHEHPAFVLSDGVASQVKCPCFLTGPGILVLPAFTRWAAGCVVGRDPFLSPYTRLLRVEHAVAIVAGKLMPIPIAAS